jgi:hypothetical protein
MKTTKEERLQAKRVSAAIDQLMAAQAEPRDAEAQPAPVEPADAAVLDTARRLAELPALLGPVDPALEQRVMCQVETGARAPRPRRWLRPSWAIAGLAIALLVALWFTPVGQTAVASFMAVFNLGRTEVRITPVNTAAVAAVSPAVTVAPGGTAVRQVLTLEEAQDLVPFAISQPTYLPPGYSLRGVNGFSYPDLPPWVPQPLFVELVYGDESGQECTLHLYPIVLGDQSSISGLNLEATLIREVQDVDVNGQPGVLMRMGPDWAENAWQEVVWEQGDLLLALSASNLSQEELLRIARSIGGQEQR